MDQTTPSLHDENADTALPTDEGERLALWLALTFLSISSADGEVDEAEYLSFQRLMKVANLPDVWGKYGAKQLQQKLQSGMLETLSRAFRSLEQKRKLILADLAIEMIKADGKIDARELKEVEMILQSIDLPMALVEQKIRQKTAPPGFLAGIPAWTLLVFGLLCFAVPAVTFGFGIVQKDYLLYALLPCLLGGGSLSLFIQKIA